MEYTHEEKVNAQQLRIIFAMYKQGYEDAMQEMRNAQNRMIHSVDTTLLWLNEIPAP